MKKRILLIILAICFSLPLKVYAAGGFGVSTGSVSLYPGDSKTISISSNNAVGKLDISSSNTDVASVNTGSIFIQTPGASGSITITAKSVGTSVVAVVASSDFATMDEEILAGQTKNITVTVKEKETTPESAPKTTTTSPKNNLSKNNNLKEISVEGFELEKIDSNNYSLSVMNSVASIVVSATAEDAKATIGGTGTHELKTGENIIEIAITSESGKKNIINLKVTRKDGYYIEDLETTLKDDKLPEVNIIMGLDGSLTTAQLNSIKNSKKKVYLNYLDENKKLIYSWILDGSKFDNSKEFLTTILFDSENKSKISKVSNYSDGMYLNFKHTGEVPKGSKIKIYVGDKYQDKELLNVYYYNTKDNKLELVKKQIEVKGGYIEFDIEHCSEYFATKSDVSLISNETSNIDVFFLISIAELIIIVGLVFYFNKIKPNHQKRVANNIPNISTISGDNLINETKEEDNSQKLN